MLRPAALAILALCAVSATTAQELAASPAAASLAEDAAGTVTPLAGPAATALGMGLMQNYAETMKAEAKSISNIITNVVGNAGAAVGGVAAHLRGKAATADALLSAYRDNFCVPAQYVPATKIPANFTSPGFSLTISMGNCSIPSPVAGAQVNCVGPHVRFRATPAALVAPYVSGGQFFGEQCAAAATFGTTTRTVLAVLDKNAKLAPAQIAAQVSGAVSGIVPTLPSFLSVPGVPLTGFIGGGGSSSATAAVDGANNAAAGGAASGGAAGGGGSSTTGAAGGDGL